MPGSLRFIMIAALVFTALAGCTNVTNMKDTPYGETFRWQTEYGWTEQTILRHGWTDTNVRKRPPVPPIYCYQTIGKVDCFRSSRPGQAGRLVGHFGPAPM